MPCCVWLQPRSAELSEREPGRAWAEGCGLRAGAAAARAGSGPQPSSAQWIFGTHAAAGHPFPLLDPQLPALSALRSAQPSPALQAARGPRSAQAAQKAATMPRNGPNLGPGHGRCLHVPQGAEWPWLAWEAPGTAGP